MTTDSDGRSSSAVITEAELLAAPAVEVRQLTKTYPGPNGAGKSTTIGMLTTTIAPTSGSAALAGFDVVEQPLKARGVSSVVFQEAVVDGGLTGRANLELHARLWGIDLRAVAARIEDL